MIKKILSISTIIFLLLILLIGSDIYRYKTAASKMSKINVAFLVSNTTVENREMLKLDISVIGELPTNNTEIIIFTDNRFLELHPESYRQNTGVTFVEMRAFGTDAVFHLSPDSDGRFSIAYDQKHPTSFPPLIYSYLVSDVTNLVLSNRKIHSRIFTANQ